MLSISEFGHQSNSTYQERFKLLWKCFLLSLLVKFLGASIIALAKIFKFNDVGLLIANSNNLMDEYSVATSIFLVILFFPIVEELAFRGWFSKSPFLVAISLSLFFYYFIRFSVYEIVFQFLPFEKLYRLTFGITIMSIGMLFIFINIKRTIIAINNHFRFFYYLSIISFSAIHIFNYNIDVYNAKSLFSIFLIIIPYPFGAYILNYIRIKNGLGWSLVLHMANNSLVLLSLFFGGRV